MLQYKMNRGQPATAVQQYINQEDVRNFVPGKLVLESLNYASVTFVQVLEVTTLPMASTKYRETKIVLKLCKALDSINSVSNS